MTLRSSDLQSDSDLDSVRNSCDVLQLKLYLLFVVVVCNLLSCHSLPACAPNPNTHPRPNWPLVISQHCKTTQNIYRFEEEKNVCDIATLQSVQIFFLGIIFISLIKEHFKSQDRLWGLPICPKNIGEIFKKCLKDIFSGMREKYPNQSVSNLIPPIPGPLLLVWAPFPTFPAPISSS